MDLTRYRESDSEKKRTEDLMRLIRLVSDKSKKVLDIGARDGYFSKLMAEHFENVTALDLKKPSIHHKNVYCVGGDITDLKFSDNSFDIVFCAEVLEHIPIQLLDRACSELTRVSGNFLLIGVPYKQDIRIGRTTCYSCGEKNPPWGHVNCFDRNRLTELFPLFNVNKNTFVGKTDTCTNFISTFFMDLGGNPYGTYMQEEVCIHCGRKLKSPPGRNLLEKIFTKAAFYTRNIQKPFFRVHPKWIHILFEKTKALHSDRCSVLPNCYQQACC